MINTPFTNVTIIGSGPAGAMASLFLSKNKIHHTILDKAVFPRDKVCGDGLSGKVVSVLKKLDPSIISEMNKANKRFLGSWGVMFVAPNGKKLDIPFKKDLSQEHHPAGFVVKRLEFDFFLANKIDSPYAQYLPGCEVTRLTRTPSGILINYLKNKTQDNLHAKIIIGADGERSIVEKTFFNFPIRHDHFYAGVRSYYQGVKDLHQQNFIELHFIKELLPGYFWIFPLPNGMANVGLCVLSSKVKKEKLNLREIFERLIVNEPSLQNRFRSATKESKLMGWGLPLGSVKRPFSCDHVMLTGDAASLIDPFTGEGIGNAMLSGLLAANAVEKSLANNNFSAAQLFKTYDSEIERSIRDELKLSRTMQQLCKKPWLFNFIASRSETNVTLRDTISCMFEDLDMRAKLRDPTYYLKLLFNLK